MPESQSSGNVVLPGSESWRQDGTDAALPRPRGAGSSAELMSRKLCGHVQITDVAGNRPVAVHNPAERRSQNPELKSFSRWRLGRTQAPKETTAVFSIVPYYAHRRLYILLPLYVSEMSAPVFDALTDALKRVYVRDVAESGDAMFQPIETSDVEIRAVLARKIARDLGTCGAIVVEELGLDHGRARIDVAVVDSCLHGYEIKSSKDTLYRLSTQLEVYTSALEKLTLVVAPAHLEELYDRVPSWCGITIASRNDSGELCLTIIRESLSNPNVDPFRMAHVLWKSEAISLLGTKGIHDLPLKAGRTQLYRQIAEEVVVSELREYIKGCFATRPTWRDHEEHKTDGG